MAFLDSETVTVDEKQWESEQLRCWVAKFVRRRHRRRAGEIEWASGTEGLAAAAAVDAFACSDKSTWLYAHNVTFDLVSCSLAEYLAALGWELSSRHALSGAAPWLILHKGRQVAPEVKATRTKPGRPARVKWQHTLTIVDSFSLFPVGIDQLSAFCSVTKPPLPAQDDDPAVWLARCTADVTILSESVLGLMDWWDERDLGKWSLSGAACGWNSYRHKIGPKDVVIDPDPDILLWEHQALYGGRRDVFRCGDLPTGRYAEIDFTAAYPTIAATQPLPCKRMGPLTATIAKAVLDGRCPYGIVAEVEIVTEQPRYPLRSLGRVFYPVGQFRTVMAGPEIIDAHQRGCLVEVGKGYFYAMSGHMQTWANWVLGLQRGGEDAESGPVRIWAKAASRSVCGKWAQRGWSTQPIPGPPGPGWSYEDAWVAGSDARVSVCGLAGQHYLSMADQESEHEFPAILAYIESHCRLRLGKVLDTAPAGSMIQCDTDGVMASLSALEEGLAARMPWLDDPATRDQLIEMQLTSWATAAAPLTMRIKTVFEKAVVYGPQHVVLDGRPRFSGVPGSAWATGENRWAARLWPGLSWQIQHGAETGYKRPVQPYLVVGPYAAGWVLETGSVRPVETTIKPDGSTTITPWPQTGWALSGDVLGPTQAGWSRGMTGRADDPPQEATAHAPYPPRPRQSRLDSSQGAAGRAPLGLCPL